MQWKGHVLFIDYSSLPGHYLKQALALVILEKKLDEIYPQFLKPPDVLSQISVLPDLYF